MAVLIPKGSPAPSGCPDPTGKSMLYTEQCIKHFNKGCKKGSKNNQEVCDCEACIVKNFGIWAAAAAGRPAPTDEDKQIVKDCGNIKDIGSIASLVPYCGGALGSESDASGWPWWAWLILGIVILVVLGAILRVVTFGILGGKNKFSPNSGWYGGYSEDY